MNVRAYIKEDDYRDIEAWAKSVDQCPPPDYILPEGCIIEDGDRKIACGFLYLSRGTCVSVLEWIHFSPESTPKEKHKALNMIIESLEYSAFEQKHPFMMTGSNSSGMVKQFLKNDWTAVTGNMVHMVKEAKGVL